MIAAGFNVVRSFDLHLAAAKFPNHSCHMVVLLVYELDDFPMTLVINGNDFTTSVFLEYGSGSPYRSKFITILSRLVGMAETPQDSYNEINHTNNE